MNTQLAASEVHREGGQEDELEDFKGNIHFSESPQLPTKDV